MRYCHHFAYAVVCMLVFRILIFFSQTHRPNKTKLCTNIIQVVLNILFDFCFIQKFIMAAWPIMCFDWLKFQKSSHKPYMWCNCFMVRMFLIWPSICQLEILLDCIDYNKLSPVIIYLVLAIKKLGACGNMTHGYNIMA